MSAPRPPARARASAASSRAISAAARSGWPARSPTSRICCRTSSSVRGTESSARRSPLAFSSSRVARLSNGAGDDEVGPDQQDILGAAGQERIAAGVAGRRPASHRAKTGSVRGSVRDRRAPAPVDRCRRSSTPGAAAWRAMLALPATASANIATRERPDRRRIRHPPTARSRPRAEFRRGRPRCGILPPSPASDNASAGAPCAPAGPRAAPARGRRTARQGRDHASPR